MSEMTERVAAALHRVNRESVGMKFSDLVHEMARAAIKEMREPTDAMKNCNEEVHWDYSCHVCGGLKEGWQAMIDEALK